VNTSRNELQYKNIKEAMSEFTNKSKEMIQYFAVHDVDGIYRGVLEVSQEISEIQNITGDRKLLNWEQ
jgi:DUF438 domain-containing protein